MSGLNFIKYKILNIVNSRVEIIGLLENLFFHLECLMKQAWSQLFVEILHVKLSDFVDLTNKLRPP